MHGTIGVFILLSKQNDEVPLLRNGYCGVQTVRNDRDVSCTTPKVYALALAILH